MKCLWIALTLALGSYLAEANTHNLRNGMMFRGTEEVGERPSGKVCYVVIDYVMPVSGWKHCYDIQFRFASNHPSVSKDYLQVRSRVSNYHRPEYPQVKTCATNIDGTTYNNDIYEDDTNILYNELFSGSHKSNKGEHHYHLTLSPVTKTLTRARFYTLKLFSETAVDCVNLKEVL
jgi:hypothetical protein